MNVLQDYCCRLLRQYRNKSDVILILPNSKGKIIFDDAKRKLIIENEKKRYFEMTYCIKDNKKERTFGYDNVVGNSNHKCFCSDEEVQDICKMIYNMNWIIW